MIVSLKALKPNPLRDFQVDPINEEAVERLMTSIQADGFWGGVVCRRVGGEIQIIAGHHRVEAAIRCGVDKADLFVANAMDDEAALRIYARENATQRGMSDSTARCGSTAAALRMVSYQLLTGYPSNLRDSSRASANICGRKGIGTDTILQFLSGVPGIKDSTIRQDLSSLKKSGHYARILSEVSDRIAEEAEEAEAQAQAARQALELACEEQTPEVQAAVASREEEAAGAAVVAGMAKKAAATAAEEKPTFDYDGVVKHFSNPHQLQVFQEMVLKEPWRRYIPIERQAEVAALIIAEAEREGDHPDGFYIRTSFHRLAGDLLRGRIPEEEEQAETDRVLAWQEALKDRQNSFLMAVRGGVTQGRKLLKLIDTQPEGGVLRVSDRFAVDIEEIELVVKKLKEKFHVRTAKK